MPPHFAGITSSATGRIGLIRGDQKTSIRALKAWRNSWQKVPKETKTVTVIREFKVSPLQPPAADIPAARPPRPGLARQPCPFIANDELADIRVMHAGRDGLLYVEAVAKLPAAFRGSLAYGSDGPVKVWVNGDLVNEGFGATADSGRIAVQAEGTEVEFRKLEIGPLPAAAP